MGRHAFNPGGRMFRCTREHDHCSHVDQAADFEAFLNHARELIMADLTRLNAAVDAAVAKLGSITDDQAAVDAEAKKLEDATNPPAPVDPNAPAV